MYDPTGEFLPSYGNPAYGTPAYGTPAYGTASYGTPAYGTASYGTASYGTASYDSAGYGTTGYGTTALGLVEEPPPAGSYEPYGRHDPGAATTGTGIAHPTAEVPAPRTPEPVFAPHPHSSGDAPPRAGTGAGAGVRPTGRPRRRPGPTAGVEWSQVLSATFVALTAATFVVVCVVGWMVSYDPLQGVASPRLPDGMAQLWPVIVNGPWLACCLSVLRAALEGRRVVYSWAVLVLFSGFSMALCIANEPHVMPDVVVAGLPPLTAVASLHQLVRQLTLPGGHRTRPAAPRPASHRMPR